MPHWDVGATSSAAPFDRYPRDFAGSHRQLRLEKSCSRFVSVGPSIIRLIVPGIEWPRISLLATLVDAALTLVAILFRHHVSGGLQRIADLA